jgi:hypothetical protein
MALSIVTISILEEYPFSEERTKLKVEHFGNIVETCVKFVILLLDIYVTGIFIGITLFYQSHSQKKRIE